MEKMLNSLKDNIQAFQHKLQYTTYDDFLGAQNLSEEFINNGVILSKNIALKDVIGYCEVHDIDLNIYAYTYSIPATPDMFNPRTLEWQFILNHNPAQYYLDKTNTDVFKTLDDHLSIETRIGNLKLNIDSILIKHDLTLNEIFNKYKEYYKTHPVAPYFEEFNKLDTLEPEKEDEFKEVMSNEISSFKLIMNFGSGENLDYIYDDVRKYPIIFRKEINEFKSLKEEIKPKIRKYLLHHSNVFIYEDKSNNPVYNTVNGKFDDDGLYSDIRIFKEERPRIHRGLDPYKDKIPSIRFAVIGNYFYIFSMEKLIKDTSDDDAKSSFNFFTIKPCDSNTSITHMKSFENSIPYGDNYKIAYGTRWNNNKYEISTQRFNTWKTVVTIHDHYIVLNNKTKSVCEVIEHIFNTKNYDEKYKRHLFSFKDDKINGLRNYFAVYLLKRIDFDKIIYQKKADIKYKLKFGLWHLKNNKPDNVNLAVITYKGVKIEDILDEYIKRIDAENYDIYFPIDNNEVLLPENNTHESILDTHHYRDQLSIFDTLTEGEFRNRDYVVELDSLILPKDWQIMEPANLAEFISRNDYDLWIHLLERENPVHVRIRMTDNNITTVDETIGGVDHYELAYLDKENSQYLKLYVSNYHRLPFDLYFDGRLYTGNKVIEREHHYDIIYIPIAELYNFMYYSLDENRQEVMDPVYQDYVGLYKKQRIKYSDHVVKDIDDIPDNPDYHTEEDTGLGLPTYNGVLLPEKIEPYEGGADE